MSDTRVIKVESCWGCLKYEEGCEYGLRLLSKRGMPINCPLPKWPSVDKIFIEKWAKRFYAFSQRRDYIGTPDSTGGIVCLTETTEERLSKMLQEAGVEIKG